MRATVYSTADLGNKNVWAGVLWFEHREIVNVSPTHRSKQFEAIASPHVAAAYDLARWLTRNPADADDVLQESLLRAYRYFDDYRHGSPRAWLLKIVRNTAYTWLKTYRSDVPASFEVDHFESLSLDPQEIGIADAEAVRVRRAVNNLTDEFREVLVLREFEDLSYREIAEVTGLPMGTVMSRLARARDRLSDILLRQAMAEPKSVGEIKS